jgi:hypothetical protein
MTTLSEREALATGSQPDDFTVEDCQTTIYFTDQLIDNSDRRDAKRLLRVVESARHSNFLVRTFFADFYAEVLPGRDLKVAAC